MLMGCGNVKGVRVRARSFMPSVMLVQQRESASSRTVIGWVGSIREVLSQVWSLSRLRGVRVSVKLAMEISDNCPE